MTFKTGEIWRLNDKSLVEIVGISSNPSNVIVTNVEDSHRYSRVLRKNKLDKLVSSPIPYEKPIATDAIATDAIATDAIAIKQTAIATAKRGGKREGSGRPATGRKERKVLQVNLDIAQRLPELNKLAALIDEFRDLAYSTALRSTNLAKFYKALDALDRIA